MTKTDVNVPLLRKALEHVTAHPEEWDQGVWAKRSSQCGTQYCLAGTVVVLSGEFRAQWSSTNYSTEFTHYCTRVDNDDCLYDIQDTAINLLNTDAYHLFNGSNTLRDLWELAAEMTNGEIAVPHDLPLETLVVTKTA